MGKKSKSLFPELDKIISVLQADERQDLVILIIPSHDDRENELADQDQWAESAMELFADLFGGATAFSARAGIYKCSDGKILHDKPILIESYVQRSAIEDKQILQQLVTFMKRMGKETRQASVAVVINNVFHEITNFDGV